MISPFAWIASAINRKPFVVAGIILTVLLIAFYGAGLTTMKTGSDTYMDKTEPVGMLLDHYTNTYGSESLIIIIEADDVTSTDVLTYMAGLEKDISNERYIASVTGPAGMLTEASGGILPTSIADVATAKERLPPEIREMFFQSGMMGLIAVGLEPGIGDESAQAVTGTIESIIAFSEPPAGVTITASGSPAFAKQMGDEMGTSMGSLIALAMLLMVVAMTFLFSHVRYRFLPVAVVACGVLLTFGVMGLTGIAVSMVVVAAFPVMIGIGIDYAIQFQSRLDEEIRHSTITEAVRTTVTKSGPSVLLAMLSTSLGFMALFIAPFPMVVDFGVTCVIGVACCYLAALIMIPTFATIVKYRPKEAHNPLDKVEACQLDWEGCDHTPESGEKTRGSLMARYDHFLGGLAVRIASNPVPILLILGCIAVVGIQLDGLVPINTDEDSMVPPDMPAMVDMNKVLRTMGSTSTIPMILRTDDLLNPDTLTWIKDFSEYEISRHDEITGARSITTLIEQYNSGSLPSTEGETEAAFAKIPEETRRSYINGKMETVIEFSTTDMSVTAAQGLIKAMEGDLEWFGTEGTSTVFTGGLKMFADMIDDIKNIKAPMTILGFGLIFAFLLLTYRKFTAVSPLVPIVMIVGWNGLIMYIVGLDYTILTATLGAMSIGVASEYTILIMERYQEERQGGKDPETAIRRSIQKIGTAVTVSGLTTVFGFSALLLCTFPMISNFGMVTVLTVGFSLVGAIIVMPAVIGLMERGVRSSD